MAGIGCCAYQTRVKHTMSGVPRVGVGVLLWQGESVLVGRRKGSHGSGQWALPGGKLDFAETLEACAARELQEEAGVQIPAESFQRAWVTSTVFDAATHYVTVFMQAEMPEEQEPQNLEPEKCSGWHWHALSEATLDHERSVKRTAKQAEIPYAPLPRKMPSSQAGPSRIDRDQHLGNRTARSLASWITNNPEASWDLFQQAFLERNPGSRQNNQGQQPQPAETETDNAATAAYCQDKRLCNTCKRLGHNSANCKCRETAGLASLTFSLGRVRADWGEKPCKESRPTTPVKVAADQDTVLAADQAVVSYNPLLLQARLLPRSSSTSKVEALSSETGFAEEASPPEGWISTAWDRFAGPEDNSAADKVNAAAETLISIASSSSAASDAIGLHITSIQLTATALSQSGSEVLIKCQDASGSQQHNDSLALDTAQHQQDNYALFDPISLAMGELHANDIFSCGVNITTASGITEAIPYGSCWYSLQNFTGSGNSQPQWKCSAGSNAYILACTNCTSSAMPLASSWWSTGVAKGALAGIIVSAFITIATVGVFAYRSRAQQVRHRAEEEAARHFAESQANNKKLAYKPPAFIQARDVSGEVLKPTSGWPVVILNYAAESTPTARFHKGELNVGYPQNTLDAKMNSKRMSTSLPLDVIDDSTCLPASPSAHTPQAWIVRANHGGRITGVDVIDMSPKGREGLSPLQSPATGSESLRNTPRGPHQANPRTMFLTSARTSTDSSPSHRNSAESDAGHQEEGMPQQTQAMHLQLKAQGAAAGSGHAALQQEASAPDTINSAPAVADQRATSSREHGNVALDEVQVQPSGTQDALHASARGATSSSNRARHLQELPDRPRSSEGVAGTSEDEKLHHRKPTGTRAHRRSSLQHAVSTHIPSGP
ncbi:hypothetical protein WJX74_009924 [Apatococcus lobatus]|uniref:Nudix hydrolase domain-containing protein n=1 Tax=Apatococcus lobatus TaxID=904363 RepID=A0AAW1SFJ0_9CHLO